LLSSKSANLQLTRNWAVDFAPYGIRVNCVCPGTIRTPAVEGHAKGIGQTMKDMEDAHKTSTILKRIGEPEEIANGIVFLASPLASYVTGTFLMIDGGMGII
jgi:NAD(P)-dependent dehydrogenase (short-subunit alcohol dehydrogenase family)